MMSSSQGTTVNPSQRPKSIRETKKNIVTILKSLVKKAAREAIIRQLRPGIVHFKILVLFLLPLMLMLSICGTKKTAVLSICSKPAKNTEPVASMIKTDMIETSAKEIAVEKKTTSRIKSNRFLFKFVESAN